MQRANWLNRGIAIFRRAAPRGAAWTTSRPSAQSGVNPPPTKVNSVGALLAGLALAGWAVVTGDTANAGIFFGAGALILIAGLSFASAWLTKLVSSVAALPLTPALSPSEGERENRRQPLSESNAAATSFTLSALGVRGCARRRKRSLATVAMLACGSFIHRAI
jgi:hypothetical protein